MEDKINEFMKKISFTQKDLFENFSYEERVRILYNNHIELYQDFQWKCEELKISLLSNDEAYDLATRKKRYDEQGVLLYKLDLLSAYLTQDQLFELCYNPEIDITDVVYKLTNAKYIAQLLDDKLIPSNYVKIVISKMDDDEIKKRYMLKYVKKEEYTRIVQTFNDDSYKLDALKYVFRSDRFDVIKSLKKDENKEAFIQPLSFAKSTIISFLKSDEKKEYYLNKYFHTLTSSEKVDIILSFKDLEKVRKYSSLLKSDHAIVCFFEGSIHLNKYDTIKRELASRIQKEKNAVKCLQTSKDRETSEVLFKKIKSPKYMIEAIQSINLTMKQRLEIFDKVNDKEKLKIIHRIKNPKALFECLKKVDKRFIPSILEHVDNLPNYEPEYKYIAEVYANIYKLNLQHLISLLEVVGCSLLNSLENPNIMHAINLNDEDFANYMKIINTNNITVNHVAQNAAMNSIIQRMFRIKEKTYIEYGSTLGEAIKNGDFVTARDMLTTMHLAGAMTREQLIYFYQKLKTDDKASINDELRPFVKEFIEIKRIEYYQTISEEYQNDLYDMSLTDKALESLILKEMSNEEIVNTIYRVSDNNPYFYNEREMQLINNTELLNKIINFKRYPKTIILEKEEKKLIPILTDIFDKTLRNNIIVGYHEHYERKKEIIPTNLNSVINIMKSINTNSLKEHLFHNPELFNEVLDFLNINRIIGWSGRFDSIAALADIEVNENIIAELINNYDYIKKRIYDSAIAANKEPQYTVAKMLEEASIFDSYSYKYSLLFGKENFSYIKANPGLNSSSATKEKRIQSSIDYIPKMYERKSIPVPGIDKNYKLQNGKELNVVVGNTTDLINLTLGERTDACMRIGGVGESLFEYALLGKKGFHIIFNDPETGNFVSRVTCFRNGNTIFMNQLRNSETKEYDNQDLIECVTKVSEELIEMTKDSESPIQNIVINEEFAMKESNMYPINLGIENPKKGMPTFYSDVSEYAIVLKTSSKDNKLLPIDLSTKVPEYTPIRSKIRVYHQRQALNIMNHFKLLNAAINKENLDKVRINENDDIITCIAGEDWYISIDSRGKIEQFILETSKNQEKTLEEMKMALMKLKEPSKEEIVIRNV